MHRQTKALAGLRDSRKIVGDVMLMHFSPAHIISNIRNPEEQKTVGTSGVALSLGFSDTRVRSWSVCWQFYFCP